MIDREKEVLQLLQKEWALTTVKKEDIYFTRKRVDPAFIKQPTIEVHFQRGEQIATVSPFKLESYDYVEVIASIRAKTGTDKDIQDANDKKWAMCKEIERIIREKQQPDWVYGLIRNYALHDDFTQAPPVISNVLMVQIKSQI